MLLRCFRVDRVYRGIINYITEIMDEQYITPPHLNFDMIFEESTPIMPVVFILSPGSDPTAELMKLADRYGWGGGKFRCLSLGQGQATVRHYTNKIIAEYAQYNKQKYYFNIAYKITLITFFFCKNNCLFYIIDRDGIAEHGNGERTMADAAKLPSASVVCERFGKNSGKRRKTTSRFSSLAHYGTYP